MKIQRLAQDQYRVTLAPAEAGIFINGMNETLQQIPRTEYQTRMGAEPQQIEATIVSLEAALK